MIYQKLLPLTHPQKRVWYNEKIYPNNSMHNMGGPIRIKGPIDLKRLEQAINLLIKEQDALRIRLIEKNGECYQYISPYCAKTIDFIDFSQNANAEESYHNWVTQKCRQVFPLVDSALYYFALFKITATEFGYLVVLHHLISDAWSIKIMTETICRNYLTLKNNQIPDSDGNYSYLEYLDLERKYLTSERFRKDRDFWLRKFTTIPEQLIPQKSSVTGKRQTFLIDRQISSEIRAYTTNKRISINSFFTAVVAIYFHLTLQRTDMVLGIPVLNRSGKKEKSIFGMFNSTMPFLLRLNPEESVNEFVQRVHKELMECYFHQKYPYDLMAANLELKKKGMDSLYQVCVNYNNTKLNTELDGHIVENIEIYNGNQLYGLQFLIKDWLDSTNLILDIDYQTALFSDKQIKRIYNHLTNLIGQILKDSSQELSGLELMSSSEKQWLVYELNNTKAEYPAAKTIFQLFEEQVVLTPKKIAVSCGKTILTYQELNTKANQLARRLRENGVGPQSLVALYTNHSPETIIGILGILKAGGAYLPLDKNFPEDRLKYMVEDSGATLALTNLSGDKLGSVLEKVIDLNDPQLYVGDSENLEPITGPEDIAYLIYTSGSTGKPKGVIIEHRGLVNYICWARKVYLRGADEVFAFYSSLAFDLTVTSIFTPLTSGCRIRIYQEDEAEFVLYKIFRENQATIVKLTPSHLGLIKDLDNSASSIKTLIVGGEDLRTGLAREIYNSFNGNITIYNEYGPTETVVGCMIHRYDPARDVEGSVPIGTPADNVHIYILGPQLRLVPPDYPGEIYISGDGVARGYLNLPDLTRERFVDNPFLPGTRMYKTGDLAKRLDDGKLVYLGRTDHQVKIRGFRIELGEIESRILDYAPVKDVVVIDRQNERGEKYLSAYVVVDDENYSERELKALLRKNLPESVIPQYYRVLTELPLTDNGKVDRRQLPAPDNISQNQHDYVGPRNHVEKVLAAVIGEILNVDVLSMNDDFFSLGGDSIKAIQIAAKLNEDGFLLRVKDILSNPVIGQMAACVELTGGESSSSQEPTEGFIELTPIIAWFFEQNFNNIHHWNQSVLLKLKKQIDREELEQAISSLVRAHDSLRINYCPRSKKLFYNQSHLGKTFKLSRVDFSNLSYREQLVQLKTIGAKVKASFNIEQDLLIKGVLFELGERGQRLLLTAHHLIVDGVSWRIILEDLESLLKEYPKDRLPVKTDSWQSWAKELQQYSNNQRVIQEKKYWEEILRNQYLFPPIEGDGPLLSGDNQMLVRELNAIETSALETQANRAYRTEPQDLLVTGLVLAINEVFNRRELLLEMEGHGRKELSGLNLTKTVGWFTTLFPVRLEILATDLHGNIMSIKEQLRSVPDQGFNFGVLKYLHRASLHQGLRFIRFNYLGDFTGINNGDFFKLSLEEDTGAESDPRNQITAPLEVMVMIVAGKLKISITYNAKLFTAAIINDFAENYLIQLRRIIEHCLTKKTVDFTPSDFDTATITQDQIDLILD